MSAPAPERPVRRVGVALIPESALERLVRVRPGQRITGITTDPMMQAVLVRVEGEGLPVYDELAYPPRVDELLYKAPPLVERADVEGRPPAEQHATVQRVLLELIEHAGHLGAATGVVPDLSVNAHAAWIGALDTVLRHAPGHTRATADGKRGTTSCRDSRCYATGVTWPCPEYRNSAQGAVFGMEVPSDD